MTGKMWIRCMGGSSCKHARGTCTASSEYQAEAPKRASVSKLEIYEKPEISAERVWLDAWVAVAGAFNSKPRDCTRYADECLEEFSARFHPQLPPSA